MLIFCRPRKLVLLVILISLNLLGEREGAPARETRVVQGRGARHRARAACARVAQVVHQVLQLAVRDAVVGVDVVGREAGLLSALVRQLEGTHWLKVIKRFDGNLKKTEKDWAQMPKKKRIRHILRTV